VGGTETEASQFIVGAALVVPRCLKRSWLAAEAGIGKSTLSLIESGETVRVRNAAPYWHQSTSGAVAGEADLIRRTPTSSSVRVAFIQNALPTALPGHALNMCCTDS